MFCNSGTDNNALVFGEGISSPYAGWITSHSALTKIISLSNITYSGAEYYQSEFPTWNSSKSCVLSSQIIMNTYTTTIPTFSSEEDEIFILEQQALDMVRKFNT